MKLLTYQDLAERWRVTVRTIQVWLHKNRDLRAAKIRMTPQSIRFRELDIERWEQSRKEGKR